MSQFLTKGMVSAVLAALCFWLATTGHKNLAAYLGRPEVIDGLFMALGTVLTIVAGVSDGIKRDSGHEAPRTPSDPYPGYDYDPIKGWVKINA